MESNQYVPEWNTHFLYAHNIQVKLKYRGLLGTQKSENKTCSGEIGLNVITHASPKVGKGKVSGGVSVP